MKIETEIISKEYIKPSSPTPIHLKIHKLSLFDQIVPPIYVPLVLYFPASENPSISEKIQILKESLSETLTRFYPLAGRVRDRLSIHCNDEGVLFKVAKLKGSLTDFLKKPDPAATRAHISSELKWDEPGPGSYVTMAQLNHFECGGIALGLLFFHKVTDGATIGSFMKSWAANATRSMEITEGPCYIPESFFPQNEAMKRETHLFSAIRQYFKFGKTVMKRYVFDSMAISKLRARVTSPPEESVQFRPSRVEIVSALIWKCFIAASVNANKSNGWDPPAMSLVTHNVNVRKKAEPVLPDQSFGNFVWLAPASTDNQADTGMKHLVCKMRTAINGVDKDFVKRMQGKDGFSGYLQNLEDAWDEFPENADYLSFSSWCNFGFYSIDFGWGSPVWITKCDAGSDVDWPFLNVCWLTDTKQGDGIEAWVTLDERYAEAFDAVQDLQALASVDPSPLDL